METEEGEKEDSEMNWPRLYHLWYLFSSFSFYIERTIERGHLRWRRIEKLIIVKKEKLFVRKS